MTMGEGTGWARRPEAEPVRTPEPGVVKPTDAGLVTELSPGGGV